MALSPAKHVPQFFSADVCRAAGIDTNTLKNWLRADPSPILMKQEDRLAVGSGRAHLFSFQTAMQVALTARLVALGLPPRRAGMVAAGFTDVSSGNGGWVGDTDPYDDLRLPCDLFKEGYTILVAYVGDEIGHVINIEDSTTALDLFHPYGRGRREVAAVVWVDFVYKHVRGVLYNE